MSSPSIKKPSGRKACGAFLCCFFLALLIPGFLRSGTRHADSLLRLLKKETAADTARVRRLFTLGYDLRRTNPDTARLLARQSLALAKKLQFRVGEGGALNVLGICCMLGNELDSASVFFSCAVAVRKELKDYYGEAATLINYASVCAHKGEQLKADSMLKRAYAIFRFYGDEAKMVIVLNALGSLYSQVDELEQALRCLLASKFLYEKMGNRVSVAEALLNSAVVYEKLRDFGKARTCVLQTLKIADAEHNKMWIGVAKNELGNICTLQKNYDEALAYYNTAVTIAREISNRPSLLKRLCNTGAIYSLKGDHKNAILRYREAYTLAQSTVEPYGLATLMNDLSDCYLKLGKKDSARFFGQRAMALAGKIKSKRVLYNSYISLSHALAAEGNYREAFRYTEQAIGLKDSLLDESRMARMAKLEAAYEALKKQGEIAQLQLKNMEVQALAESRRYSLLLTASISSVLFLLVVFMIGRSRTLKKQREAEFERGRAELEQKALRAQMNPHFIFNSLNSIQRMYVEGNMAKANDLMADFSNLMRRILDNSNKNYITLREELETLRLYLEIEQVRCNGQFAYRIEAEEAIDLHFTKIPPLVIQPFVENAIWHGILPKKSGGTVLISLSCTADGQLQCAVEDDGVGLKETIASLHEPKGISITEARLGTKISLHTPETGGTRISFIIPSPA